MSQETSKEMARRIIEEVFGEGKLDLIDELTSPDIVNHSVGYRGRDEYKGFVQLYRAAFPDLDMRVVDRIGEGDLVAHHWRATGTHQGELMGIPPTGKKVDVTGTFFNRVRDGLIVEEWGNWDQLGMLQQLGVVPEMG